MGVAAVFRPLHVQDLDCGVYMTSCATDVVKTHALQLVDHEEISAMMKGRLALQGRFESSCTCEQDSSRC